MRADHAVRHYHCGRCDYAWSEADQPVDADRRKPTPKQRSAPRQERRKADAT